MPYYLVVLAVVLRFIPHPAGFTPIGAIGLFAGANMGLRRALLVPLAVLLIGDLLIGFYDYRIMAAVYVGFLVSPVVGRYVLTHRRSAGRFAAAVFSCGLTFFLISNLGNWWVFLPHTVEGLVESYVRGLPYFGVMLLGDSIYTLILFAGADLLKRMKENEAAAIT